MSIPFFKSSPLQKYFHKSLDKLKKKNLDLLQKNGTKYHISV